MKSKKKIPFTTTLSFGDLEGEGVILFYQIFFLKNIFLTIL
jgi:hypothetical protein